MPATSLQQLKIPRGYRGDWPLQEYALIDAVEATINEIEVARGSNTSLAAELEETYATKTYVQLAIANPNINDIYVSDLAVKVSEAGLVGYTLQVRPGNTLAFTNTYTLGNGTLANPAIKFNTSVSGGLFMTQNSSHETMNVKVSGGVALEIVHDKVSGANRLKLGNLVAYSDGDIEATDITARAITSTGTGAYATHLAEAIIGEATINTLNVSTTVSAPDISFSYFGTILVLDAQNLNTLPSKSLYARTTNTCTNTPEVSAGYLNHYWSGAGQSRQTWVSSTTGYLYERVNNGAWTKYAKAGGDSNQTFNVATATSNTHAVTKLALDDAVLALQKAISDEATARGGADTALQTSKAGLGGSNTQRFKVADAVDVDEAVSLQQLTQEAAQRVTGDLASAIALAGQITRIDNLYNYQSSVDIWGNGHFTFPTALAKLKIQFGQRFEGFPNAGTITFPEPFSGGVLHIGITPIRNIDIGSGGGANATSTHIKTYNTNGFTYSSGIEYKSDNVFHAEDISFFWFAIGY